MDNKGSSSQRIVSPLKSSPSRVFRLKGEGQFVCNEAGGIVADNNGKLYINDPSNACIQCFNSEGVFLFQFGEKHLSVPGSIAFDSLNERLIVLDIGAQRVVIFNLEGRFLFEFGSSTPGKDDSLSYPQSVAVDKQGNIFVTNISRGLKVKMFSSDGEFIRTIGKDLEVFIPLSVDVLSNGNIVVGEHSGLRIFTPEGELIRSLAMSAFDPWHMFIDAQDNIHVVNDRSIHRFTFHETSVIEWKGDKFRTKTTGITMNKDNKLVVTCADRSVHMF